MGMAGTGLTTDLYELMMAAGYRAAGLEGRASFELYGRELPPNRSYLIAAGLEQALAYLETLRFSKDDIAYLRSLPAFERVDATFFDDYLPRFRFTGDVWAVPEGTPVFPPAPFLRVTAPLPEAQLVETALLSTIAFQTSVASRAARMIDVARGRTLVEFGARRAHGVEAGVLAARAAYVAGCDATSNTEAGRQFGIPVAGTMAHAWVTSFPEERRAFEAYYDVFGPRSIFLLDTYDTLAAARMVAASPMRPRAVRIDSGDLDAVSRQVRTILDAARRHEIEIFVSGDLDEYRINDLVTAGAPVNGFGVGAALSTSSDAPSLGAIYKPVEIERDARFIPVMKFSPNKHSYPGRKQVWRVVDGGVAREDILGLVGEAGPGVPLLQQVMAGGRRVAPPSSVADLRQASRLATLALPAEVRRLNAPATYPVRLSGELQQTIRRLQPIADQVSPI